MRHESQSYGMCRCCHKSLDADIDESNLTTLAVGCQAVTDAIISQLSTCLPRVFGTSPRLHTLRVCGDCEEKREAFSDRLSKSSKTFIPFADNMEGPTPHLLFAIFNKIFLRPYDNSYYPDSLASAKSVFQCLFINVSYSNEYEVSHDIRWWY